MSNRRFIEISSATRNRIQYPSPADFEVPFAPSRTLNQNQTTKGAYYNTAPYTSGQTSIIYGQSVDVADPITTGIVEYYWFGGVPLLDSGVAGSFNGTTSLTGVTGFTFPKNYNGNIVVVNNGPAYSIVGGGSTLINFNYTGTQTIPNNSPFVILGPYVSPGVIDSSTLQTVSSYTTTSFYVNVNGLSSPYRTIPNYYVGYLLRVNNLNAGIISSYTPGTGCFTVEIPLLTTPPSSGQSVSIIDPSNGSNAVIPITSGTTYNAPARTIVLPAIDACGKAILYYDQAYNGYYLVDETRSSGSSIVSSPIVSYNFYTNTITLAAPLSNWTVTDRYSIRKTLPSAVFVTPFVSPTPPNPLPQVTGYTQLSVSSNSIYLPSTASATDNFYTGQYIYMYPTQTANNQITPLTNIEGSCFYINSYIGGSIKACTVSPVLPASVTSPTAFYPSYTSGSFAYQGPGNVINIVSLVGDNYTPLIYNGSVVSQNETVAYEISLVNLTLPNITLVTGSRAAYYPYLYVQLSNVTASSGSSKNIIYSNNPNSADALFLVPITDITDPLRSPFIKLDAGSMVQTVKFKPNDCLRFSVFLPSGQLYQTVMSDYFPPSGPNPLTQIDALFGIKRLTGV